jgi:hypothetical protein
MRKALLFILVLSLPACKKNKEYCWQVYDTLGNEMGIVCGKTESEIQALYGPFYDRTDARKYCWKIQNPDGTVFYPENITEKMAGFFFQTALIRKKITCGYCQKWSSREKGLQKSTGYFTYKPIRVEYYCGDTCNTLFPGRIIILRETPDSLITVEFLQKL